MYMNIKEFEKLTAEEIWSMRSIEDLASSLQTKKLDNLASTISTLSAIAFVANRKDALYLLCGYYSVELKNLNDKGIFLEYIGFSRTNYYFLEFLLTDLSNYKNLYRNKKIIDFLLYSFSYSDNFSDNTEIEKVISIINEAKWGIKLKNKFIDKLLEHL